MELISHCKSNMVVNNPEYITAVKMGRFTRNIPKHENLYMFNGKDLIMPVGLFNEIAKFIDENDEVITELADNKKYKHNNTIPLYTYQEKAVNEMIKKKRGILIAPTGSGKTQMGISLICKLGYKALWLTHTTDLLTQSYERARQYLDGSILGKIGGGKVEIGEGITFATIQTLSKIDLNSLKYEFNTIIVDETHRVSGTIARRKQFKDVLNNLAARYKYGLTATLHRADNMERTTISLIGDVGYIISEEEVKDKIIKAEIIKIETGIKFETKWLNPDGTLNYTKYISLLGENEERNRIIIDRLIENKNNSNLVLCSRIEHIERLYKMLPKELIENSVIITGSVSKDKREKSIEKMKQGTKRYMFATYSLAKEGLDIPRLNRLFMCIPQKDKAIVVQSVGRIRRTFQDKENALVYDFVDNFPRAKKQWNIRKGFYKSLKLEVHE